MQFYEGYPKSIYATSYGPVSANVEYVKRQSPSPPHYINGGSVKYHQDVSTAKTGQRMKSKGKVNKSTTAKSHSKKRKHKSTKKDKENQRVLDEKNRYLEQCRNKLNKEPIRKLTKLSLAQIKARNEAARLHLYSANQFGLIQRRYGQNDVQLISLISHIVKKTLDSQKQKQLEKTSETFKRQVLNELVFNKSEYFNNFLSQIVTHIKEPLKVERVQLKIQHPKEQKEVFEEIKIQKRGEHTDCFLSLTYFILENQVHEKEGYKLSNYISCQDELMLLKTKYLPKASTLKKCNKIFEDKDFPAVFASLTHLAPAVSKIKDVTTLKWEHYSKFYKNPQLFSNNVEPNDIHQGGLGDCYFLSSLACLAEYRNLIERLFEYYDLDNGYFLIWLCIGGKWQLIELDGYFPLNPKNNSPAFSHNNVEEELWVMLLQKAYAKAYGSFEQISSGVTREAIKDLTGAPGKIYKHSDIKEDELWQKLVVANQNKFIMSCATPEADETVTDKQNLHPESINKEGIVLGHAYSILDLKEYKNEKLIQLRNPWGKTEWNGEWSDNSQKWTDKAKRALDYCVFNDDGLFWMPFSTYFLQYNSTSINNIQPEYFYSSEQRKQVTNVTMKINGDNFKQGYVMVAQKDNRFKQLPHNTPYVRSNIIGLEYNDGKVIRQIDNVNCLYQRQCCLEINNLKKGSDIIVLISLQKQTDINICSYTNCMLDYKLEQDEKSYVHYLQEFAKVQPETCKEVVSKQKKVKTWTKQLGQYYFMMFKNATIKKDQLENDTDYYKINCPLTFNPNNIQMERNQVELCLDDFEKIAIFCGRIIDRQQPFGFGSYSLSF